MHDFPLTLKPKDKMGLPMPVSWYLYQYMVGFGSVDMSFPLTAATDRLVDTYRFLYDVSVLATRWTDIVFLPAIVC